MTRVSRHFELSEFASPDGVAIPAEWARSLPPLCRNYLEPLRRAFGPVTVNSGFRSAQHNARVGGARLSMHTYIRGRPGAAADVTCARGEPEDWWHHLRQLEPPGLGRYPSFCHVDNRLGFARW